MKSFYLLFLIFPCLSYSYGAFLFDNKIYMISLILRLWLFMVYSECLKRITLVSEVSIGWWCPSSNFVQKIPWTEPGRLQSTGRHQLTQLSDFLLSLFTAYIAGEGNGKFPFAALLEKSLGTRFGDVSFMGVYIELDIISDLDQQQH